MYQLMSESSGNVIAIKVSEKLTEQNYQSLIPLLEKAISEYGKIRLLWNMEKFEGWNLEAMWQDLKFDTEYKDNIHRYSLSGYEEGNVTALVAAEVGKRLFKSSSPSGVFHIEQLFQVSEFIEAICEQDSRLTLIHQNESSIND